MTDIRNAAYIRTRSKHHAYDLLIREFKRSGMTEEQLAERADTPLSEVKGMLARPRDITIGMLSRLVYCMTGCPITFAVERSFEFEEGA